MIAAHDPIVVLVERARLAAHRGRIRWRDSGGPLADYIDRAMDEFEAELRSERPAGARSLPPGSVLALPAGTEGTER